MLAGLLFPVADRPSAVATGGEGEPVAAPGPRAGEANGRGAVRLVEEHGATIVGEPAVSTLAGRGLRAGRSRADPDPTGQQLAAGGGWACSRFSRVLQGLIAVALEAAFEPVPLRPLPALGRHPRGFRVPAYRPRGGFLRADRCLEALTLHRSFDMMHSPRAGSLSLDGLMLMLSRIAVFEEASPAGSRSEDLTADGLGSWHFLLLSAWCGLTAGLLEVGVTVLRKQTFDLNHLYWMSRHFVWLVPLTDLLIFLTLGVFLSLLVVWGRRGRWLAPRLLCTFTLLPPIWAASPRIFGPAGFLLALGVTTRLVPILERHAAGFRRLVRLSFPIVAGLVPLMAASLWGQDRMKEWREAAASATACRKPQRSPDRPGYCGGGPSEPLRLRPSN